MMRCKWLYDARREAELNGDWAAVDYLDAAILRRARRRGRALDCKGDREIRAHDADRIIREYHRQEREQMIADCLSMMEVA